MAAYGWITRKFIRNGEVTPDKLQYNTSPVAVSLVASAAAVVAVPGPMYSFSYTIPAGAATYKFAVPFKCEIVDVEAVKLTANASGTAAQDVLTFKNGVGGSTICVVDLVNTLFATTNIKRATSFTPANTVVPAGGIVELTTIQTVNVACTFSVHVVASP